MVNNQNPAGQIDNKGTIHIENNGLIRNFPTSVMINTGSININSPAAELNYQRWEVSLRAARLNTGSILSEFGRNPILEEGENR